MARFENMNGFEIEYWIINKDCLMKRCRDQVLAENISQAVEDFHNRDWSFLGIDEWIVGKPFIRQIYAGSGFGERGRILMMSRDPIVNPEKVKQQIEFVRWAEPYFGVGERIDHNCGGKLK